MTQQIKQARDALKSLVKGGGNIGRDGQDDGGHKYLHGEIGHDDWHTILALLDKEIDGEWQPIETAPRDGKLYLCFEHVEGRPDMSGVHTFVPSEWVKGHPPHATHWMPLPKPPAKDE